MAVASSCCVMERPKPRSEPSTERRERSLSPSFMEDPLIAICKYNITYRYFVKHKIMPVFNNLQIYPSFRCLFWLAERLQVDSQLLALLIEGAGLQAQCPRYIGHVEIVAPKFLEQHFPFERFSAFSQRARRTSCGKGRCTARGSV